MVKLTKAMVCCGFFYAAAAAAARAATPMAIIGAIIPSGDAIVTYCVSAQHVWILLLATLTTTLPPLTLTLCCCLS